MTTTNPEHEGSRKIVEAAVEAVKLGYQPVTIKGGSKAPVLGGWQQTTYTLDTVAEGFADAPGVGLRLGEASGGLVDVDLDHPLSWKLRRMLLPPTAMRTGREHNADSHYWYRVTKNLPGYRKFTLPGGETLVELRSTKGHQTVIPPSMWHPKPGEDAEPEPYRWEGDAWGGDEGALEIDGKVLQSRVLTMTLIALLLENWPRQGSRHDAYLALAGSLLRYGDTNIVHPYWRIALPQIIEVIADATHDEDGGTTRVGEVVPSTVSKLDNGDRVQSWGTLARIVTNETVEKVKDIVRDLEGLVDWESHLGEPSAMGSSDLLHTLDDGGGEGEVEHVPSDNPLDNRESTWEAVDMEPYLAGLVKVPEPTVLRREDGKGIFYPGRVNSLYGRSESAKSWVAGYTCLQEMEDGERVMYVDLEDDPAMSLHRLRVMGLADDVFRQFFTYIRPEGPIAPMQRDRYGGKSDTPDGRKSLTAFEDSVRKADPSLIIVDGMSVLYGLHGLNTNDVMSTDVITNWLKKLTGNGRRTVVVIDHTNKGAEKGALPTGSQHKISMVQGSAIQVVPVTQPKPGAKGHVELVIGKDRPGKVREIANDDKNAVVADVYLDSTVEGQTVVTVKVPDANSRVIAESDRADAKLSKNAQYMDQIVEALENHPGQALLKGEIRTTLGLGASQLSSLTRAIKSLVSDGTVGQEIPPDGGNRHRYYLVDHGDPEESDDD